MTDGIKLKKKGRKNEKIGKNERKRRYIHIFEGCILAEREGQRRKQR